MDVFYLNSSSVSVFPTTKRQVKDRESRLFTEKSIVDIINRLLDVDAFIVPNKNYGGIKFNIKGYYFNIDNKTNVVNAINISNYTFRSGDTIYANIFTDRVGNYTELYGTDVVDSNGNTVYDGLVLSLNSNLPNAFGYLKILKYNGTTWEIPQESYIKYKQNSIGDIDLGEVSIEYPDGFIGDDSEVPPTDDDTPSTGDTQPPCDGCCDCEHNYATDSDIDGIFIVNEV